MEVFQSSYRGPLYSQLTQVDSENQLFTNEVSDLKKGKHIIQLVLYYSAGIFSNIKSAKIVIYVKIIYVKIIK